MPNTKITIPIPVDLHDKLNRLVPWGMRKHLVNAVLDMVLDAIAKDGDIVMGAIMARTFKLQWEAPSDGLSKKRS